MMNKTVIICMILVTSLAMCGCRLARPDGLEYEDDRLVGVYIAGEAYEPPDDDSLTMSESSSLEELFADDGKIYGALKKDEDGEAEYVFQGLSGISFIYAKNGSGDYREYFTDSLIGDVILKTDPDGTEFSLCGTV